MNKELMDSLIGKVIKIDRGGPESRVGKLMAVGSDHITLLTKDEGIIYYNLRHIKSLTNNAKKGLGFEVEVPDGFEFIQAAELTGTLEKLKYHWIKINRGGPEKLEGILNSVDGNYITVIANEEVIRVSMYHVKNISYGAKVTPNKGEDKNTEEGQTKKSTNQTRQIVYKSSSNRK